MKEHEKTEDQTYQKKQSRERVVRQPQVKKIITDRKGGQRQNAETEHHLPTAARQHMQMKIERLHQVSVDRARPDLVCDVPFRAHIQKDLERHPQDSICDHLLEADAERARRLAVERFPYPVDGVHPQVHGEKAQPEIKAVDGGIVKGLSRKRPEDLHKMVSSLNCCIDPAPAAKLQKQGKLTVGRPTETYNLTTTRDLCDRLYLAAPTPDNNS